MAIKRRLKAVRIDKIAAVDLPCQEYATVGFIKRALGTLPMGEENPIAKVTFDEALNGAMVSERVNRVFWDSFDGLWQQNDAFRTALTDELAEGGDGSVASADYIASVNELVNGAVAAARTAGASASDDEMKKAINEAAESWIVKYQQPTKEHPMNIISKAQLLAAVSSFSFAKSSMADAEAITDAAVALDAIDALADQPELSKMAGDKKKQKEGDQEFAAMKRKVAILDLAEPIRKHFDGLPADAQDAFLAKSAADQQAEVESANATDPVVHKCLDGTEIRKSDGAAVLAMAKRMDNLSKENGELREANTSVSIEKRARDQYPNVALSVASDMLKTASNLGEDTEAGKAVIKSLVTMNKASSTLFKNLGTTEAPEIGGDIAKARQDFKTEVDKVAREDKIGLADAMSKVRNIRPDLFAAAYPENADADEDA